MKYVSGCHKWLISVSNSNFLLQVAQHLATAYGGKAFDVAKMAQVTGQRWPIVGKRLVSEFPYIEAEVKPFLRLGSFWFHVLEVSETLSSFPRSCTPSRSTPAPPSTSWRDGHGSDSWMCRPQTKLFRGLSKSWAKSLTGVRRRGRYGTFDGEVMSVLINWFHLDWTKFCLWREIQEELEAAKMFLYHEMGYRSRSERLTTSSEIHLDYQDVMR